MPERDNPFLTVIVGATNSGKTTLTEQLIMHRKRVLAITPHFKEWEDFENINPQNKAFWKFNGTKRVQAYTNVIKHLNGNKSIIENKNKNENTDYFRNGVFIFDDSRMYVNARVEDDLYQILQSRDQRKTDIFVVAHGLTVVPPMFFLYVDKFIMFRTQDNLKKRKNDLIWYNELVELQQNVNKIATDKKLDAKGNIMYNDKGEIIYKNPHYFDVFKTK